jgi:uncharacterized membrane protein
MISDLKKTLIALGVSIGIIVVVVVVLVVVLFLRGNTATTLSSSSSGGSNETSSSSSSSAMTGLTMPGNKYLQGSGGTYSFAGSQPFRVDMVVQLDNTSAFLVGYINITELDVVTNW